MHFGISEGIGGGENMEAVRRWVRIFSGIARGYTNHTKSKINKNNFF